MEQIERRNNEEIILAICVCIVNGLT